MKNHLKYSTLLLIVALPLNSCGKCNWPNMTCSEPSTDSDSDIDTDTYSDADVDSDTSSDTEWDFGETVPCEGYPNASETCIPGGKYLMGCMPDDAECDYAETPLVVTTLSPFFIDTNETIIEEALLWLNDVKDEEGFTASEDGLSWLSGEETVALWGVRWGSVGELFPIVYDGVDFTYNTIVELECPAQGGPMTVIGGFSWLGAKMYCEWKGMQLPTEAQWEAAARGQTFNIYPCGTELAECSSGNYACCSPEEDCFSENCNCCAPFSPENSGDCMSPFGLTGIYGNAAEWTSSWLGVDHSDCSEDCIDPQPSEEPPFDNAIHVLKGGDVDSYKQALMRVSHRAYTPAISDEFEELGTKMTGVRCVRPGGL